MSGIQTPAIQRDPNEFAQALGWVNVKTNGAVGDGVHDDTAAIQAAATAALGKTLYFPNGTYLVAGDAPFSYGDTFSGTRWIFDHQAEIKYTGTGTLLTLTAVTRGSLSNFELDGLNVNSTTGGVLSANGIFKFSIRRLTLITPSGVTALEIDNSNTGMIGVHVLTGGSTSDSGTKGIVLGSDVVNAVRVFQDGAGQISGYYYGCENGNNTGLNQDNRFEGLAFEGNQYDLHLVNDENTIIRGCYFESTGTAAVYINNSGTDNPSNIIVEGNFFTESSGVDNLLISGFCSDLYMSHNFLGSGTASFVSPGDLDNINVDFVPASSNWNVLIRNNPAQVTPPASPLVSGTSYQNKSGRPLTIYQPVYASTSGTAGSIVAAIAPPVAGGNGNNSEAGTLVDLYTQDISGSTSSTAPAVCEISVPPMWFYSFTATKATLADATMMAESF